MRFVISYFVLSLISWNSSACYILFLTDGSRVLVGNHEDWFAKDSAIKINPPGEGRYGSVIFTFQNEGWAQGGMNEHGLFFDAAYTPFMEVHFDDHLSPYTGYLWQAVLDKCKTVQEALLYIQKFAIPELSESHIMLADANGLAVIVGVKEGKIAFHYVSGSSLLQTNFNLWHPELSDEPTCWRYEKTKTELQNNSTVSKEHMKSILEQTHQDSLTVYSNIYDLKNRSIRTYNRRHFNKPLEVSLPEIFKVGNCMLLLDEWESDPMAWAACSKTNSSQIIWAGRVIDAETGAPIPYVNIGILNRNIGTLSDPDGSFELTIPAELSNERVIFSAIGFDTQQHVSSSLRNNNQLIQMHPNSTLLESVTINANKRFKQERLGWMGGKDGMLPLDTTQGGGAVAILLKADEAPFIVDKLQVRLMYNSKDTLAFRLHFYSWDSIRNQPGKELLNKEIILTESKRYGWLRFDLRKQEIVISERKFLVGFEWIDKRAMRTAMIAGLKEWERWKGEQYKAGNTKVELVTDDEGISNQFKYHGNMMDWPGFEKLPPFTGLMIETGKTLKTETFKTFERKTSFGPWNELNSTLNAVITVLH
jgi:hypothetical protein